MSFVEFPAEHQLDLSYLPGRVLEPDVEDVLQLEFRNDMGTRVPDTDIAKIIDVVLVGQYEHRQSGIWAEGHVTRVDEFEKGREDALTLGFLVQFDFLQHARGPNFVLFPVSLVWFLALDEATVSKDKRMDGKRV